MTQPYSSRAGKPYPLGATRSCSALNFAVVGSPYIQGVTLCLFHPESGEPLSSISLDPSLNRTGNVWHIEISEAPTFVRYCYKVEGVSAHTDHALFFGHDGLLIDPYARCIASHPKWGESVGRYMAYGVVDADLTPFDWQNDRQLHLPMEDLVIYEMHVRGFTADPSSRVSNPGTYLGVIEKIPYLQELGVNAVELLPMFEFDECSYSRIGPVSGRQLYNYWGYMPLNYFSPMMRYASRPGEPGQPERAIEDFKVMVRELHKAGIEVILDVVYNHTGEDCLHGPSLSMRGLAPAIYYLLDSHKNFTNYSGTGNTLNANHPVVRELIIDSLRYWAGEMHVDGFRFDLASTLVRGGSGAPLSNPPLIEAIAKDPILASTKLISEPWDAGGLYHVGHFPYVGRFSEWNGIYRDQVRRFIKGTEREVGHFAARLSGSDDLYKKTGRPASSVNFLTAHDGFTLRDMVTYNEKHNLDNGEEDRDGANWNESWNCGAEGETDDDEVLSLRRRQMRNFHLALMLSQGVPMILMGDEYGHTLLGNNNAWCHDSPLNWFQWDPAKQDTSFLRYYKELIHFRKRHRLLRRHRFFDTDAVTWHGHLPSKPDWSEKSRFIALTLHDHETGEDLYAAFNAHWEAAEITIPTREDRFVWCEIVNTAAEPPDDFTEEASAKCVASRAHLTMLPHSALLLKALPRH